MSPPAMVGTRVEPASSRWFRASHPKRGLYRASRIAYPALRLSPYTPHSGLRIPHSKVSASRHPASRPWKSDQVRPSQTFQIYEPDPKPQNRPQPRRQADIPPSLRRRCVRCRPSAFQVSGFKSQFYSWWLFEARRGYLAQSRAGRADAVPFHPSRCNPSTLSAHSASRKQSRMLRFSPLRNPHSEFRAQSIPPACSPVARKTFFCISRQAV